LLWSESDAPGLRREALRRLALLGLGSGAAAAGKTLGCMVTDTGGIDDRSFNASAWAGMQAASKTGSGINVKYLQSTTQADYVPNINTFISQKCNIIVTVGFLMGDATQAAAKAHPSQKFAIVDFPAPDSPVNQTTPAFWPVCAARACLSTSRCWCAAT